LALLVEREDGKKVGKGLALRIIACCA